MLFISTLSGTLRTLPQFRQSSVGAMFNINAVNYADKELLLKNLSEVRGYTTKEAKDIASLVNDYRSSLISKAGNSVSRYLTSLDSFLASYGLSVPINGMDICIGKKIHSVEEAKEKPAPLKK